MQGLDAGTSDDSGRASEQLHGPGATRDCQDADSSRDHLSDVRRRKRNILFKENEKKTFKSRQQLFSFALTYNNVVDNKMIKTTFFNYKKDNNFSKTKCQTIRDWLQLLLIVFVQIDKLNSAYDLHEYF